VTVLRDVTERKCTERDVSDKARRIELIRNLRGAVTSCLTDTPSAESASGALLSAIGAALEWHIVELWVVDPSGETLSLSDSWHDDAVKGGVFDQGGRRLTLHPGQDIAGRAWSEGHPVAVRDITGDPEALRRGLASVIGLHGAAAFPITFEEEVTGVIALFSRRLSVLDDDVLQALDEIGHDIGVFLDRERGEQAIEESAQRLERLAGVAHIGVVYQPIVDLDTGAIFGYEALARPAGYSPTASVTAVFTAARLASRIRELDWVCRRSALRGARCLPGAPLLFLNVSAEVFLDPMHPVDQLLLLLQWAGWQPERTVLETSVRDTNDAARLRMVMASYREHGFRFALDDITKAPLDEAIVAATNPDFLKVAGCAGPATASSRLNSGTHAAIAFAKANRAQVIAVGIETPASLETMRALGVNMGQGFMLGEPGSVETLSNARGS